VELKSVNEKLQVVLEQLQLTQEQLRQKNQELAIAHQALEKSTHRYMSLIEASPVGIFCLDTTGQCTYVNTRWSEMTGRPAEAGMGMEWLQIIHPEDQEPRILSWNQWVQTGEPGTPYQNEGRIVRPDGTIRWFYCLIFPEINSNGSLVGYIGFLTDITTRKQAEIALQQSEEKFRHFAENSHAVVWIAQPTSLDNVYVNPAYETIWGRSRQSLKDRPDSWLDAIHPDDRERVRTKLEQQRQGETSDAEYRIVRPDGSVRWIWDWGFAIRNEMGQVYRYGGIAEDITTRKQAEEKIREQAALLDITTDAIFVRDLKCCILYWNGGAERLYGWLATEVLGRNDCEFLYKQISPSVEEALRMVIEQGEWQGDLNKITKSGQEIIVCSRWTLMRDGLGQPKSILTVDTDITEKKQLQTQFYRAQRLESLGTLASGIAHNLNNILTPILAAAQLLPLKFSHLNENEQQRELLNILEENSKRGSELVKQITAFAHGSEQKRLIPLQTRQLLQEIEQIVKSTFPKSIEICIQISSPNLWTVLADSTQIHQVLMNLCINARDAMPQGGILSLCAENFHVDENFARMNLDAKVGDYVVITVSDTGCGMAQEVQERIFEPFFTTKELGKGTGLGLSTTIGIIKNHGGFINVYSKVGEGSQFQVYLRATDISAKQSAKDSQTFRGNGELILVVDDEASVRNIVQTSLEEFNYKILTASNGIDAFSLYAEHKNEISLVLMDIQMSLIDGLSVIRVVQQINPKVKIIAISGQASNFKLLEASGLNVQAFLPKPYTIAELLNTIFDVLSALG
jgi:PAS domain S-box-containing protein